MENELESRRRIVAYLQAGAKGDSVGAGRIGVELEHFILDENGCRVPYEGDRSGCGGCSGRDGARLGVEDILEQLVEQYPQVTRTPESRIMGCARPSAAITIEPASQIELSIAPLSSIDEIQAEYRLFADCLESIVAPQGYSVCTFGYSPWGHAADLPLIPKARYHFMDAHFKQIPGMHAERMMRGSASTQISIDFADEADAVRKMRIATLLGPVFSLMMDNVPVFEGEPNQRRLRRLQIWREVDPARCQVVPGLFDEGFGFGTYADWLLDTPPVFSTRGGQAGQDGQADQAGQDGQADQAGQEHATGFAPAKEVYADAPLEEADIEHLLGMCWPDVRLKRYIEIRQADSAPLGLALAYASLIKGLFYEAANLDALENALGVTDGTWPYREDDVEQAIASIVQDGYGASVYGRSAGEWAELLLQLADGALRDEAPYLKPLLEKVQSDKDAEAIR